MNYAKNINDNIKALLEARNLSIRQFAEQISIPASTLTDSLKSKKGLPVEIAIRVADALGFSVEQLSKLSVVELLKADLHTQIKSPELSKDEAELLRDYRLLSTQGQEFIRQTMVAAVNTYKKLNFVSDVEASGI
ncbi:hypothetical protein UNSWDHB_2611 [Dehalobacter sp. UNSWDHB]|uniref:helix-turn-helix transcriptional regulator n=1 Tax=Dehalobacter sp. UNSWDHB TaxID=1339256 RepID=UPI00038774E6|nr:helix-turn-helix domain-containing protein [Dehalobacter sp. UNSWDHB]EQB20025.1 hypothetical protein UNSWDHB_2611 [Dehalobacter sp. UNSWDHB]